MIKILCILLLMNTLTFSAQKIRLDIGARAYIHILDEDIKYLARIDSGARTSSLHALNIKLEGDKCFIFLDEANKPKVYKAFMRAVKNEEFKRNIGRIISFDTANEKGETRHIKTSVVDVARVRNSQGVEYRYVIRLGLQYKGSVKYKKINLRDRSRMHFKLLIGRNWLNHDYNIKTELKLLSK